MNNKALPYFINNVKALKLEQCLLINKDIDNAVTFVKSIERGSR